MSRRVRLVWCCGYHEHRWYWSAWLCMVARDLLSPRVMFWILAVLAAWAGRDGAR